MEDYAPEIIDNIKHEPERHFVMILLDYQESSDELDEITQETIINSGLRVKVRKFNENWKKTKIKLMETFFVCDRVNCDFISIGNSKLKRHYRNCKGNDYTCSFCDKKIPRNDRKTHELQEHRKESMWQCSQCPFNTLIRKSFLQHCLIHFKKNSCETCAKKFAKTLLLENHQMQHRHGVYVTQKFQKRKCSECWKSFATMHYLQHHKLQVHGQRIFYCDLCGKISKTRGLIKLHMNLHAKISCPLCGKPIAANNKKKHMKSLHSSGESYFACHIQNCMQKFSSIEQLNEHHSIHIGTKRYKCPRCNYEATELQLINTHMKSKSHRIMNRQDWKNH